MYLLSDYVTASLAYYTSPKDKVAPLLKKILVIRRRIDNSHKAQFSNKSLSNCDVQTTSDKNMQLYARTRQTHIEEKCIQKKKKKF